MTSRWLKLLEVHVEKGALGLAAAFLVAMLYMYLIRSPNKVSYGGRDLGPRDLLVAIKEDADKLDQKVRGADMDDPDPEDFSKRLRKYHAAGIFGAPQAGPTVPRALRLAASFGQEIVVPGLKESEEASGSIVLVRPLKPSPPKLRTGRSLVLRETLQVAGLEGPPSTPPPEESVEADEVAWVTVAAYFNKKAQYNEMIKAGYAPYRSKAYIVGLDVQRKEVLSSGEFSDWQEVVAGKAMPQFELVAPVFDDETGELSNKDEIRQAFGAIKVAQPTLMQPPFYVVEGGDFWEIPPLAGYEDEEEEEEQEEDEAIVLRAGPRTAVGRTAPPIRGPRSGERRTGPGRGRLGAGPRSGRGIGPSSGRGYPGAAARTDAEKEREARKEIRKDLAEAKKLLGQKLYDEARSLAQGVLGNQYASPGYKRKAKAIIKAAERWIERESGRELARAGREAPELITKPETGEPAVWFHDDTVEAGKTYRYRMRVKLWNRYVGHMRVMQDPEQAKQVVVDGEWSFPSEPVTVTPSTYFFFSGSRPPDTASADVWSWHKGRRIKQRFDVSVGDVIGHTRKIKTGEYDEEGDEVKADIPFTTGAVLLDLRFNEPVKERLRGSDQRFSYRDKTSSVMVYLDPADGQVKERVLIFDRRDPKRKALEDEAW